MVCFGPKLGRKSITKKCFSETWGPSATDTVSTLVSCVQNDKQQGGPLHFGRFRIPSTPVVLSWLNNFWEIHHFQTAQVLNT